MLHLESMPPHRGNEEFTAAAANTTLVATPDVRVGPLERCTSCGNLKRQSPYPYSTTSLEKPSAKRADLCHPVFSDPAVATDQSQNDSLGSGKVIPIENADSAASPSPVPPIYSQTRQTVLNRSHSDITGYMGTQETEETNGVVQVLKSLSGEISKIDAVSPSSPSPAAGTLPPLPPVVHRSISEPIPSDYQPVAGSTPSRAPSAARTSVTSPSSDQESSTSKRVRKIKEKMKQMSQWVEKVAREEDENEDGFPGERNTTENNKNLKAMSENETDTNPDQEVVGIEERGGNLMVHIKCPCGNGYEILLCRNKCYQRLAQQKIRL